METVGIICEYNPFHNGHARQLRLIRQAMGEDCAVVCLMSGNYVQRGEPAVFPKMLRAEAALRCGANLVLELPLTAALSSAEGFAFSGVSILSELGCDRLCFGVETRDTEALLCSAKANLDPRFDGLLRQQLDSGCSYAAARQLALEALGAGAGLSSPNDILAVEYCKALLRLNSPMHPLPLYRTGSYHAPELDPEAPSASALRRALTADGPAVPPWQEAVPDCLRELYATAPVHTLEAGERAMLALLRCLPEEGFRALPYGTEGLWSKLMKNCRRCASVEQIVEQTKSKRYARARIRRMLLCAVLGLSRQALETPPPYVRILGFDGKGRRLLRGMKKRFALVNAGERPAEERYYALETRAGDLYGLFSRDAPEPAAAEAGLRILCRCEEEAVPACPPQS